MNDEITKLVDTAKIKWRLDQIEQTGEDPISEVKSDATEEDVEGPQFDDEHVVDSEEAAGAEEGDMSNETPKEDQPVEGGNETPKEDQPKGNLEKKQNNRTRTPKEKPNMGDTLDGMSLA